MGGPFGTTAIAGAASTEYTFDSGRAVLELAVEACGGALDAAGLAPSDVDGIASYSAHADSVPAEAAAAGLGLGELGYVMDFTHGGQAPCFLVLNAALAISAGMAETVLVFRALNGRSGQRVGRTLIPGGGTEFRYPSGYLAYPQFIAMWCRRYMIETGATEEDLGAVVIAQRDNARDNERALRRTPLTLDAYLSEPFVADPFRRSDCTIEVDGACALVVTSLERARDLRLPPIVVRGGGWVSAEGGLDTGDLLYYDDTSRNFASRLAPKLWTSAGLGPADVDIAELYDCFTGALIENFEGLGLCERGGAGAFHREGRTRIDGTLPTNTNGGLLSEGYLHGMNTVAEAVWQLQGRSGPIQVPGAEVGVVTSGGLSSGSGLVLTVDR